MKPCLCVAPSLEMGTLRASATFQDPDVRLAAEGNEGPVVTIEEGGVTVELEFPDVDAVRRFQHRVAMLPAPGSETDI